MSLRASTMSGARSSIMLAARNAGLPILSAFAAASWTSRSVMIHISLQTRNGYHGPQATFVEGPVLLRVSDAGRSQRCGLHGGRRPKAFNEGTRGKWQAGAWRGPTALEGWGRGGAGR